MKTYIEFARPFTLLAPFIGFASVGFAALGASNYDISFERLLPLILGAIMASALNIASNGINQIFDFEIDAMNKPTRPLPAGSINFGSAWIFTILFFIISLILAWFASPPEGGRECFIIVLITSFLVYAYSGPPFRTKRFWWLSNFTISLPRGLLLPVAGWSSVATVADIEPWFLGLVFGLFILGAATTKDFSDIAGDKAGGCVTLPIRYGVEKSAKLITPFFIFPFLGLPLGVAAKVLNGNSVALTVLGVGLSVYGVYIAYLILRKPSALATEANHISWKHMYLQMVIAQVGIAVCYWV